MSINFFISLIKSEKTTYKLGTIFFGILFYFHYSHFFSEIPLYFHLISSIIIMSFSIYETSKLQPEELEQ